MFEDEEMWFNKDDFFETSQCDTLANGSVTQASQRGDGDATTKMKNCFVSLKLCPTQNGLTDCEESTSKKVLKCDENYNVGLLWRQS